METCSFCGNDFKLVKQHSKFCKMNPNRLSRSGSNNPRYGKTGGNQYTKAASEGRVFKLSNESRKKISEANKRRIWTDAQRKKHSNSMLEAVKRNPDSYSASNVSGRVKTYTFDGMKFKGKWELKVAKCLKASNIKYTNVIAPIEYKWDGKTHLYFPDFYLEDYDLYIEVKGYERDRDRCKWNAVKNLIVFKAEEIASLDTTPIEELLIR
ncbi:hypothetical protein ABNavy97_150 [Acinetobacter phage AB-Navy97]|nr:hypothetical protein ABNavy97_150 [Acinetobacter phage AB-Navy97]